MEAPLAPKPSGWDLEARGGLPAGVAPPHALLRGPERPALNYAVALSRRSDANNASAPLPDLVIELADVRNRNAETSSVHRSSHVGLPEESGSPTAPISQGIPPELSNLAAEIVFVLVCTASQVVFALTVGQIFVTQTALREALGISPSQTPWLVGSSMLAAGLSVIISGSFADLAPPKPLLVGAFLWEAIWNAVTAVAIRPNVKILFFVARALQGLALGVLVSSSMSILGRVYNPGIRKTRVFSMMAAGAPFGYWIGCVQGGALSAHLPWIFGSTSIFLGLCAVAAQVIVPSLRPADDNIGRGSLSLRQFDYAGALLSSVGCGLILFGLTQGTPTHWNPYTYSTIIAGFLMLVAFYFVEQKVPRPLIPNGLWKTPGFTPLLISYALGFGAYGRHTPVSNTIKHASNRPRRWSLAILRHPVLAALPGNNANHCRIILSPQCRCRSVGCLDRLQNAACGAGSLDFNRKHVLLCFRPCVFPAPDFHLELLGPLDAGSGLGNVWPRHELRSSSDLHHVQRA